MEDDFDKRLAENMKVVEDIQRGFRNPITQVAFRAGFIMCREIMARFVEQGGDKMTAASIRANWLPEHFGDDPGGPSLYDFAELVESDDPPFKAKMVTPSREGACYACVVMNTLSMIRDSDGQPKPTAQPPSEPES